MAGAPVSAQPVDSGCGDGDGSVVVLRSASQDTPPALVPAVRELVAPLGVAVCAEALDAFSVDEVLAGAPADGRTLARMWLVARDARVRLYIADARSDRVLIRTVPAAGGIDPVAQEQLIQIIASTIEALLAGAELGVDRRTVDRAALVAGEIEPVEPVAPVATAAVEQRAPLAARSLGFEPELRMQSSYVGPDHALRHTLLGAGQLRVGGVGLGVAAGFRLPATDDAEVVRLATRAFLLRAEVAIERPLASWRSMSWQAGAGGGIEVETITPQPGSAADIAPRGPATRLWPLATAQLALRRRLGARVSVALAGSVDAVFRAPRFVIDTGDGAMEIATPWRIRPAVWLGVRTEL